MTTTPEAPDTPLTLGQKVRHAQYPEQYVGPGEITEIIGSDRSGGLRFQVQWQEGTFPSSGLTYHQRWQLTPVPSYQELKDQAIRARQAQAKESCMPRSLLWDLLPTFADKVMELAAHECRRRLTSGTTWPSWDEIAPETQAFYRRAASTRDVRAALDSLVKDDAPEPDGQDRIGNLTNHGTPIPAPAQSVRFDAPLPDGDYSIQVHLDGACKATIDFWTKPRQEMAANVLRSLGALLLGPDQKAKDCKPQLGCATTRELIEEVAARMSIGDNLNHAYLRADCERALQRLRPKDLDYRTFD